MQISEYIERGWRMGDVRRVLPFAGASLILLGALKRSPLNVLLGALGGVLVYEGLMNKPDGNAYEKGMPTLKTLDHTQGVRIEQEIVIQRSPQDLYRFWRNLENLPRVMRYLESVRQVGPIHSHWVAKSVAGMQVEWDAEIIQDVENERIAWRSTPGADIPNAGSVHFIPVGDGARTLVHVNLKYDPPARGVGITIAKLLGSDPNQMIREDLERFKAFMEMS